jgi:hypothetical protein
VSNDEQVTAWVKAKASTANGTCVEMRGNGSTVEVRDTKANGQGPTLAFSKPGFAAWIQAARSGALDHLGE